MSDDRKISKPLRQLFDLTSPEAIKHHRKLAAWIRENKTVDPWQSIANSPPGDPSFYDPIPWWVKPDGT